MVFMSAPAQQPHAHAATTGEIERNSSSRSCGNCCCGQCRHRRRLRMPNPGNRIWRFESLRPHRSFSSEIHGGGRPFKSQQRRDGPQALQNAAHSMCPGVSMPRAMGQEHTEDEAQHRAGVLLQRASAVDAADVPQTFKASERIREAEERHRGERGEQALERQRAPSAVHGAGQGVRRPSAGEADDRRHNPGTVGVGNDDGRGRIAGSAFRRTVDGDGAGGGGEPPARHFL
mmetsp:Transcript_79812/g.230685  ORF Transcript_79812/g.230685 Transcript_79812/m.230685 type:complete len:231 (+) Transcript_79812:61-753(+)